ncbi:hypothetical protein CRG98_046895 [Punica granatum]|uniref:Uncharacterized protein n=1 Tax=Punica granatum TaxID=22663 RepID=A0A2I0HM33_PUNGR|nr:hypothetical protein CRG98_046895 [Punica granatum]
MRAFSFKGEVLKLAVCKCRRGISWASSGGGRRRGSQACCLLVQLSSQTSSHGNQRRDSVGEASRAYVMGEDDQCEVSRA